jgi:hypothetical protein
MPKSNKKWRIGGVDIRKPLYDSDLYRYIDTGVFGDCSNLLPQPSQSTQNSGRLKCGSQIARSLDCPG